MTNEEKIDRLEQELKDLRKAFSKYIAETKEKENRRLRAALVWIGSVILAIVSFVWLEVVWPILKSINHHPTGS